MKVHYGFDNLPSIKSPVVTMGSYDGVHSGHRQLLGNIVELAKKNGGESVVITFSPHPRTVLEKEHSIRLLTSLEEKITLLEQIRIDHLIVIPFDKEFSEVSSYGFVKDYLIDKVGVATLVVGYNHHFGHNKEGDYGYLHKLENEFGFEVHIIRAHEVDHGKVSSTVIRRLISEGKMKKAADLLGYPYFMYAVIEDRASHGARGNGNDGCGSDNAMPSSGNASYSQNGKYPVTVPEPLKLLPPPGVYDVTVRAGMENGSATLEVCNGGDMFLAWKAVKRMPGKINVIFT